MALWATRSHREVQAETIPATETTASDLLRHAVGASVELAERERATAPDERYQYPMPEAPPPLLISGATVGAVHGVWSPGWLVAAGGRIQALGPGEAPGGVRAPRPTDRLGARWRPGVSRTYSTLRRLSISRR